MQKVDGHNTSVCSKDFFSDQGNGTQSSEYCKPKCSSWLMFSQSVELTNQVIIGLTTIIGILSTIVIIFLSCAYFKSM